MCTTPAQKYAPTGDEAIVSADQHVYSAAPHVIMTASGETESAYAWVRLAATVLLSTIGGVGMWSVVVALPTVQAEFGVARAGASFAFTATMLGYGIGGILMGRLADRFGIVFPVVGGAIALCLGYIAAGFAANLTQFAIAQGLLIAMLGSSSTFGPLIADVSHWFSRRRGIAVGICASGNYLAGTVWPPVVQHFIESVGWRQTHMGIGLFCAVTMIPLALVLRRRPPVQPVTTAIVAGTQSRQALGLAPNTLQVLLAIAGVACCVAMSMPRCTLSPTAAIWAMARRAVRRCCR